MLDPQELRNGTVFKLDGKSYIVLKYEHNKRGRGHATIRVKIKDLVSGSVLEKTFTDGDKLEKADVMRKNCQYLYSDDTKLYFMDNSDFSQFEFSKEDFEWEFNFLTEGLIVQTLWLDGEPVGFELPANVELKVISTYDAVAGDTSSQAMKEATLETNFETKVPLFISNDMRIKVSTSTGEYMGKT